MTCTNNVWLGNNRDEEKLHLEYEFHCMLNIKETYQTMIELFQLAIISILHIKKNPNSELDTTQILLDTVAFFFKQGGLDLAWHLQYTTSQL